MPFKLPYSTKAYTAGGRFYLTAAPSWKVNGINSCIMIMFTCAFRVNFNFQVERTQTLCDVLCYIGTDSSMSLVINLSISGWPSSPAIQSSFHLYC